MVIVGVSGCAVVVCVSLDEQHEQHEQYEWHRPTITAMMVETTQLPTGTATAKIFLRCLSKEESTLNHLL